MSLPSVASLARQHNISWHEANRRYSELAQVVTVTSEGQGGLDLDRLAELVARKLGRTPEVSPAIPECPPPGIVTPDGEPRKIGVIADTHYPYQDDAAVACAVNVLLDWGPDLLIHLGDIWDFYVISRFAKNPLRAKTIREEIASAKPLAEALAAFDCPKVIIKGNHDDRFDQALNEAGLAGVVSVEALAGFPEDCQWVRNQGHVQVGPILFMHGDIRGRPGGKHAARTLLDHLNVSFVCGHFHRESSVSKTGYHGNVLRGMTVPCLARLEESWEYNRVPDATQGFATVEIDHESGLFSMQNHLIRNGQTVAFGNTYTGN